MYPVCTILYILLVLFVEWEGCMDDTGSPNYIKIVKKSFVSQSVDVRLPGRRQPTNQYIVALSELIYF